MEGPKQIVLAFVHNGVGQLCSFSLHAYGLYSGKIEAGVKLAGSHSVDQVGQKVTISLQLASDS